MKHIGLNSMKRLTLIVAFLAALLAFASAYAQEASKPLLPPQDKAAVLRMDGEVDDVMLRSLKRRVFEAEKAGCTVIILEIDTYGGALTSTLEITHYIKSLKIPTVAWVHDKALSAGSIIAVACNQMVISEHSIIGAAAPINSSGEDLGPDAKAKAIGVLYPELDESAKRTGVNPVLLHAMVSRDIEIYELRNINTGEKKFVDGENKTKALAETIRTPDGQEIRPWRVTEPPVDDKNSLLTVDGARAVEMGIASRMVNTEQELIATLNIRGEIIHLGFSWSEELTRWLVQWPVRMGLFILMLVLGYVELTHPGISVAGIGALICLVLLVGAPWLSGLAQMWEIILIVVGLVIIIIDLVHGGLGLLAIPGFLLLAVGLVGSFVPASGGIGWSAPMWSGLLHGLSVLVFGSAISLTVMALLAHYLEMTPGLRHLRLAPAVVTGDLPLPDAAEENANDAVFLGALGTATTDLRPAGKAKFGGHIMDVVTDGGFIARGTQVKITEVNAMRIVVIADTHGASA